jgi:hypothetical protein
VVLRHRGKFTFHLNVLLWITTESLYIFSDTYIWELFQRDFLRSYLNISFALEAFRYCLSKQKPLTWIYKIWIVWIFSPAAPKINIHTIQILYIQANHKSSTQRLLVSFVSINSTWKLLMQMRCEGEILRNPCCTTELMYFNNGTEDKGDSLIQSCACRRQTKHSASSCPDLFCGLLWGRAELPGSKSGPQQEWSKPVRKLHF